jgi:hypothetical protein
MRSFTFTGSSRSLSSDFSWCIAFEPTKKATSASASTLCMISVSLFCLHCSGLIFSVNNHPTRLRALRGRRALSTPTLPVLQLTEKDEAEMGIG